MLWILLVVAGFLVVLMATVVIVGMRLPRGHTATRSLHLPRTAPEAVWAAITDIDAYPTWRPGMREVTRLSDVDGRTRWREHDRNGKITFEVAAADPPARLVTRIADPGLPFGGAWTYLIEGTGGGSTLTVTEDGEVFNPVYRFVSRYVMGHTAGIDRYLTALAAKFGEPATIGGR
jgi:uncharacterized protein YndB with AHSA1/START domain